MNFSKNFHYNTKKNSSVKVHKKFLKNINTHKNETTFCRKIEENREKNIESYGKASRSQKC